MSVDGKAYCLHGGCHQWYVPAENQEGCCTYHTGEAVFHDGEKYWSCCPQVKVLEFEQFMKIPGCAVGKHDDGREYGVCLRFVFDMEKIRSIIGLANDKVMEGDIQGAISYFETAFKESQTADYIGGLFCSSRRLGDIYYNLVLICVLLVDCRITLSMQLVGMRSQIRF